MERIERWEAGGVSLREFAEQEGVRAKTLQWWRGELRRRSQRDEECWKQNQTAIDALRRSLQIPSFHQAASGESGVRVFPEFSGIIRIRPANPGCVFCRWFQG